MILTDTVAVQEVQRVVQPRVGARRQTNRKTSSSYYLSRAECIEAEKTQRLNRLQLLTEEDRMYHTKRLEVLELEKTYWREKIISEKAVQIYWEMKTEQLSQLGGEETENI